MPRVRRCPLATRSEWNRRPRARRAPEDLSLANDARVVGAVEAFAADGDIGELVDSFLHLARLAVRGSKSPQ